MSAEMMHETEEVVVKKVRKKPQLMSHEYDGIREYDNPTPGWWHLIFLGTLVYSFMYVMWYALSPVALSNEQAWQKKQVAEYQKVFGTLGNLQGDEATIVKLMNDGKLMSVAQGMFISNCSACHGKDGGGINGVNLCDDSYKNAKNITELYKVISTGANAGAMPAWSDRLGNNERVLLAAYAASLRGTTPANPKAAEGEKIAPWPKPVAEK